MEENRNDLSNGPANPPPPTQERPTVSTAYIEESEGERLLIQALIHEAWTREMARKRGFAYKITLKDQQALELALRAFTLIPGPNGPS